MHNFFVKKIVKFIICFKFEVLFLTNSKKTNTLIKL